jgi:hypothetical protein
MGFCEKWGRSPCGPALGIPNFINTSQPCVDLLEAALAASHDLSTTGSGAPAQATLLQPTTLRTRARPPPSRARARAPGCARARCSRDRGRGAPTLWWTTPHWARRRLGAGRQPGGGGEWVGVGGEAPWAVSRCVELCRGAGRQGGAGACGAGLRARNRPRWHGRAPHQQPAARAGGSTLPRCGHRRALLADATVPVFRHGVHTHRAPRGRQSAARAWRMQRSPLPPASRGAHRASPSTAAAGA